MSELRKMVDGLAEKWESGSVIAETDYIEGKNDQRQACAIQLRALLSTADSEQLEVVPVTEWGDAMQLLDEMERDRDSWKAANARAADVTLANAALRTALVYKPHGSYNACRLCGQTWWNDWSPRHSPDCIATLPGDDGLREMSCPTCEAVRRVAISRSMICTVCYDTFQTPEQLDATLTAVRAGKTP